MSRPSRNTTLDKALVGLVDLDLEQLRSRWRTLHGTEPSNRMSRLMLVGGIAYRLQEEVYGGLPATVRRFLERTADGEKPSRPSRQLKAGTVLLREWQGVTHQVTVLEDGVMYRDRRYRSLSAVAKQISGIHRSGPDFFGMKRHGKT